jgi:hypothetical protein
MKPPPPCASCVSPDTQPSLSSYKCILDPICTACAPAPRRAAVLDFHARPSLVRWLKCFSLLLWTVPSPAHSLQLFEWGFKRTRCMLIITFHMFMRAVLNSATGS